MAIDGKKQQDLFSVRGHRLWLLKQVQGILPSAVKVGTDSVRQVAEQFFGGSVSALLNGMVDAEMISHEELQDLVGKIRDAEKKERKLR